MLEVCLDSLLSAKNAVNGGADELEVCSVLQIGGLTPSVGLVYEVMKMVKHKQKHTKVNVMLRCRGGDDFIYTDREMETMLADLRIFKEMKVDRFVFGALTDSRDIDDKNCTRIIQEAHPIPVTFHRAFDFCVNPISNMEKIASLGFNRILTSGQSSSAPQGFALVKTLIKESRCKNIIQIMPGGGITEGTVRRIISVDGCDIIHCSCKKTVNIPVYNDKLHLGPPESNVMYVTDEEIVKRFKSIIAEHHKGYKTTHIPMDT